MNDYLQVRWRYIFKLDQKEIYLFCNIQEVVHKISRNPRKTSPKLFPLKCLAVYFSCKHKQQWNLKGNVQTENTKNKNIVITWLATPTGQLLVWQIRAMTQPVAIIATDPKPYSSAPMAAAMRTSIPLLNPPSTLRMTLSRKPFWKSIWKISFVDHMEKTEQNTVRS